MSVSFNKHRERWCFKIMIAGTVKQGYCVDENGKPVTTQKAAERAEAVVRNKLLTTAAATPAADPRDITLEEIVAELVPVWKLEQSWLDKQRHLIEIVAFFGKEELMRVVASKGKRTDYTNYQKLMPRKVWLGGPGVDADRDDPNNWRIVKGQYRSNNTINKYNNTFSQIIEHAKGKVDANGRPLLLEVMAVKTEKLDIKKRKARPIPEPVLQRLMELLPKHVVEAMTITLIFGFRKDEAFGLTLKNIDWRAGGVHLFAENVKDGEDVFLPTTDKAMGYLHKLAKQAEERKVKHLITYRRRGENERWHPMKDPKTAWGTAMKKIKAEFGARWRWHDIRAAFITHVAMTSGQMQAQALARHSDFATTKKYIEVADTVLRDAGERAAVRPALTFAG